MDAIKQTYDDLPEQLIINIPKNMIHRKAEVIIITEESKPDMKNAILNFYGSIPDFPDRFPQGNYESRESL
jgi:hypothetical protein